MKISWNGRDATGRFALEATPDSYDAVPPLRSLLLDRDMPQVGNDLLGVASALAFGEYCEGRLELPRSVSPEAASAIEEFLSPANVRIGNIDFEPFANSLGEGYLYLDISGILRLAEPNVLGAERISTVSVLDSGSFAGALSSMDGVALGSNANALGYLSPREHKFFPSLAVAVLFSESLRARTIVVDDSLILNETIQIKLSRLLSGCKLILITTSKLSEIRNNL